MTQIQELINDLANLIKDAKKVPLANLVLVEQEKVMTILDLLKITLPDEINEAQKLNKQREQIIDEAQQEAEKILEKAREKEEQLINESQIIIDAEAKAKEIILEAQKQASYYQESAMEWVDEKLNSLESLLHNYLASINVTREEMKHFLHDQEEKEAK